MSSKGYLDNAATAAPLPQAVAAAARMMEEEFGNPSSIHAMGARAREALERARRQVAEALGCRTKSVFFTSGGTECANTAILSALRKGRHIGRHIVTTEVEHEATINPLANLRGEGFEITHVSPGRDGIVPAEDILAAVRPDTVLVAIQAVNNETGAIMPYEQVGLGLKNTRTLLYLDGVPAFCKTDIDLTHVAMASISGHKIGGIKGSGGLYAAEGLHLLPLLYGGGQERGLRPGTEAMPAIAAFGAACAYRTENRDRDREHLAGLKRYLLESLDRHGIAYSLNSPRRSLPHIVNFSLTKGRTEVYIRALEAHGVYVSGGSACARGKKSHVLLAMKLDPRRIDAALRVSFCPENTTEDVDMLCTALKEAESLF